jgi:hypothetical protein
MQCINILKWDDLLRSRTSLLLHLCTLSTRRSSRLALDRNRSSQRMKRVLTGPLSRFNLKSRSLGPDKGRR